MRLEITLTDEQAARMKAALLDAVVPEPAKRREWTLHRQELNDFARIVDASPFPHSKRIRVREVLPGDPSPEQVEELLKALDSISRRSVIMGSTGDYREGQLDALAEVRTIAKTALKPFTGKELQ